MGGRLRGHFHELPARQPFDGPNYIESEREVANLIDPLLSFGSSPDDQNLFDYLAHVEVLGHDQQTGTCRSGNLAREVRRHGLAIMGNKDSALPCGERQHLAIAETKDSCCFGGLKVQGRLAPEKSGDDFRVQILVSLKPRPHSAARGRRPPGSLQLGVQQRVRFA